MTEVRAPLTADPSAFGCREMDAIVDRLVVGVANPDSAHRLQRFPEISCDRPNDADQERRSSNCIGRPHKKVAEIAWGLVMFVVKRADDSPEAVKDESVQQVLQ